MIQGVKAFIVDKKMAWGKSGIATSGAYGMHEQSRGKLATAIYRCNTGRPTRPNAKFCSHREPGSGRGHAGTLLGQGGFTSWQLCRFLLYAPFVSGHGVVWGG